jgi:hypothetical protein
MKMWTHGMYIVPNCNIIVILVAHLQQILSSYHMQLLKKSNMVDYMYMYDVYKLLYRRPIFNSLAIIIQLIIF